MTKFDKEYLKLCKKILTEGVEVENRTGINTIKIPAYSFEFDLGEEYPVLTTKKTFFKKAILEMLWIYQAQSNDVRWLQERDIKIWDEWEVDADGIYRIYDPHASYDPNRQVEVLDLDGNKKLKKDGTVMTAKSIKEGKTIKTAKFYGKKYAYTIGTAYGWIANNYRLTQNLINTIKNNPTDRRMVMTLWQNEFLKTAVLPSCVWSSEWDVTDGKLNIWVHQRSCDVPLGLPFNITQYATLLCLIAHCTGLKPGKMYWSIKDAHIYVNQIEGIKEQIERGDTLDDLPAPELWINPEVKDFFEIDNSLEMKDIKVKNYQHHGKITFPLAQ